MIIRQEHIFNFKTSVLEESYLLPDSMYKISFFINPNRCYTHLHGKINTTKTTARSQLSECKQGSSPQVYPLTLAKRSFRAAHCFGTSAAKKEGVAKYIYTVYICAHLRVNTLEV